MIEFRVLGLVEARREGREIPLGGPRQRALLAYLLLRANRPVPADELIETLWPNQNADGARQALRVAVSRLRAPLGGEDVLATRSAGYELVVPEEHVDLHRFRKRAAEAEEALDAGDPSLAAARYRDALALWRGRPLEGATPDGLEAEIEGLEEQRLQALEGWIEAELRLGRHAAVVGKLDALVRQHPHREGLRRQHMLALYRSARQAEALESYREARARLVDELGIEPSPELQTLERAILRQDPSLAASPAEPPPAAPAASRTFDRRRAAAAGAVLVATLAVAAAYPLAHGHSSRSSEVIRTKTNSVVALDERSGRVVGSFSVGGSPRRLVAGAGAVWVLLPDDSVVVRIDPRDGRRRPIGIPSQPSGIAAGADGIWVAGRWNTLTRIDPTTGTAEPPTRLARDHLFPNVIADVTATRDAVWLASRDTAEAARYSLRTGRVQQPLGAGGDGSFFHGAGTAVIGHGLGDVWLTNRVDEGDPTTATHTGRVTRLAGESGRVLRQLRLPSSPTAVAASREAIWIAGADRVWRLGRLETVPTRDVRVPAGPVGLAADERGAWVVSRDRQLLRIDSSGARVVRRWRLDRTAAAVAVGYGRVWIAVGRRD